MQHGKQNETRKWDSYYAPRCYRLLCASRANGSFREQRNDLLELNKGLLPIPTERRETAQQDVSDHTGCPDVHLEAISDKRNDAGVSKVSQDKLYSPKSWLFRCQPKETKQNLKNLPTEHKLTTSEESSFAVQAGTGQAAMGGKPPAVLPGCGACEPQQGPPWQESPKGATVALLS